MYLIADAIPLAKQTPGDKELGCLEEELSRRWDAARGLTIQCSDLRWVYRSQDPLSLADFSNGGVISVQRVRPTSSRKPRLLRTPGA